MKCGLSMGHNYVPMSSLADEIYSMSLKKYIETVDELG